MISDKFGKFGVYTILIQYANVFTHFEGSEEDFIEGLDGNEIAFYRIDQYSKIFQSRESNEYEYWDVDEKYTIEYPDELGLIDKFQSMIIVNYSSS
jgi:hypothetical protein